MKPVPLSKLGTIFTRWHDAPAGTLVTLGSRRMAGQGNNWQEWDDPIVAICVDGDGAGPCMVSILPEILLIMQPPAQGHFRHFHSVIAYSEPAVDVSPTLELAIENLAPINQRNEFVPGDVIMTPDGQLIFFAAITGQERFVVLSEGQSQWHLVGRPHPNLHIVGKLSVVEKKPL